MAEITELEGWTALPEAAFQMGIARQTLHWRVNQGLVPSKFVRQVPTGSRRLVLISDKYIVAEIEKKQEATV